MGGAGHLTNNKQHTTLLEPGVNRPSQALEINYNKECLIK